MTPEMEKLILELVDTVYKLYDENMRYRSIINAMGGMCGNDSLRGDRPALRSQRTETGYGEEDEGVDDHPRR